MKLKQHIARMDRRVSLQRTNTDKRQSHQNAYSSQSSKKRRFNDNTPSIPGCSSGKKSFAVESQSENSGLSSKRWRLEVLKVMNECRMDLSDKLTTEKLYYTGVGNSESKMLRDIYPKAKVNLEVPRWRIKPLTCTYTMEGTENLSDDVFNRKHYKLMIDEKKRKRWNIQRIREQQQIEKHRSREHQGNND